MKNKLTAERLREVLDYDPETGAFVWRHREGGYAPWNGRWAGKEAGCVDGEGYVEIRFGGVMYLAHRLAWLHTYGVWPTDQLDHRNRVKTDNRIANLRPASSRENQGNVGLRSTNTSGVTGVVWHKQCAKWQAQIKVAGRNVHLGLFEDLEAAKAARQAAETEYFGEFAVMERAA